MKDPYLIKGKVCEIVDPGYIKDYQICVAYFHSYDNKKPRFVKHNAHLLEPDGLFIYAINYRPIGTEWDFSPLWAVCSTIDPDGGVGFWESEKVLPRIDQTYKGWTLRGGGNSMECGICPDKSRYQGDNGNAWKISLRMRPEWAKNGKGLING